MTLLPGKTLFLHITGSQCFLWLFPACGRHLWFWKQRKSEESRKCDCWWIRWVWGERICTARNCTYKGDMPSHCLYFFSLPWPLSSRCWLAILGSPVTFRGISTYGQGKFLLLIMQSFVTMKSLQMQLPEVYFWRDLNHEGLHFMTKFYGMIYKVAWKMKIMTFLLLQCCWLQQGFIKSSGSVRQKWICM